MKKTLSLFVTDILVRDDKAMDGRGRGVLYQRRKKILSAVFFGFLVLVYALSYGANFKMICDDLDQTGGKSSSTHYKLMVSAGGQSSAIGSGNSTHYKLMAGYVGTAFVLRGDANADGAINSADVVYLLNYLFAHGSQPVPLEAGDPNCDGAVNSADVVYLINYLFAGGSPPCDP
jgi:hypothetical protein